MGRIELRYSTPYLRDGLAGTAAVNQTTAPATNDTSLQVGSVVLNTKVTTQVPIGGRFTIAGEVAPTIHVVTGRTQGSVAGADAKQSVTLDVSVTGGTFTLAWGGATTAPIAYNATLAAVLAALEGLGQATNWIVTGAPGAWVIEFTGALGNAPQALLVGNGTNLVGTTKTVTVASTQTGVVPIGSGVTTAIVFAPALGADTYSATAALTFMPQLLEIKIGDGDLKYSENSQYHYDLDRGLLDVVRDGDDVPMDVNLNFTWVYTKSGTGQCLTVEQVNID